jgi:poly(A) polymerase
MDSDPQKKREHELEKRLRTPKSIISKEKFIEADTEETAWLINTFLAGRFYLIDSSNEAQISHFEQDHTELDEIYQREQTLSELKDIIKEWIVTVAKETGMEENLAKEEEAKIFTFGSHRLGVNSRGGDIDTLVLCPNYVDRNTHFFEELFTMLQKEQHVEELVKVNDPKVLVPVIKMKFHGIPIDLAFAKLDLPKVDKKLKNLNDQDLLTSMDEKMGYSMNGPRNVDFIIQSVDAKEDPLKISNFRTTLKLLKLWAKNKGIYSNAMGYVTGISLAILVAKICQLFPNLKPNKLVQKFFQYYSMWNWNEFPVKIEEIKTFEHLERFNEMQWYDPTSTIGMEKISQRKKDEYTSPMMVITPAFPCMNSTKKVTRTNLEVIKDQLQQGKEIVQQKPINWHKLFERIDFFHFYYNFIEVSVLGNDEKEFYRWKGLIESQLIVLTKALETRIDYQNHPRHLQLHPYPVGFERSEGTFKYCHSYYYGLKFDKPSTNKEEYVELYDAVYDFICKLMAKKQEGQYKNVNMKILHLLREDLPECVFHQPSGEKFGYETTKNLKKRPLEKVQTNELEPNIIKKVQVHTLREDIEAKSANFTNSTTASPHEIHDSYGLSMTGLSDKSLTDTSLSASNKENVEYSMSRSLNFPNLGVPKSGLKSESLVKTSMHIGKASFKPVETPTLDSQGKELDEFL